MKKEEKRVIFVIIAIFLVIIAVVLIMRAIKPKEENNTTPTPQTNTQTQKNTTEEKYVNVQPDGSKVNTSSKLKEKKTIDGLEVSNIRLVESGNVSNILADVKNPGSQEKGGFSVTINILDESGNVIIGDLVGYINKVKAGETAQLNMSATADFANAYDFTITKK